MKNLYIVGSSGLAREIAQELAGQHSRQQAAELRH